MNGNLGTGTRDVGCVNLRKIILTGMKETSVDMLRVILGRRTVEPDGCGAEFAETYVPMDEEDGWLLGPDVSG